MKMKELKALLAGEDDDREVVLHHWNGKESGYIRLNPSANLHANTKNLFVLVDGKELIKPLHK